MSVLGLYAVEDAARLDSARQRHGGRDYPWSRASDRRDWMISREGTDYPDDAGHVKALEDLGVRVHRGSGRLAGPGRVEVAPDAGASSTTLEARAVLLAAGSVPFVPPIDGLERGGYWTSRDATSTRELPSSLVVLGGGPVGVELAQVFARFDVRTTVVEGADRILPRDHALSSKAVADQLIEEGVTLRSGVTAEAVEAGGAGRKVRLSDGSVLESAQVLVAVGRRPADLRELGAEEAGAVLDERGGASADERLAIAENLFVAGDAAGGLQFTHLADYEGRVAARAALGRDARVDLSAVPRATYTDPETGAVGRSVEEARDAGLDAFEVSQDFASTAKGQTVEGSHGHVSVVVDRGRGVLAGAFAAAPGAAEFIHEAALAIKIGVPVSVLADTIHAFPAGARVFGGVVADAAAWLS